ncbi:MAG: class I adenylate cyclase [Thermodesulfobacteriota bacterium]|nr:class I adenylate cyclase [Thermodesulfobacteriota bacterium]
MAETPFKQELDGCLKRLKGLTAHLPPERIWPQITGVLDSFLALKAKTDKEKAELKGAIPRMAFLLYARVLATESKAEEIGADGKSLIDIYLEALAGLRDVGAMLLTRLVRRRADKGENPGPVLSKIPKQARLWVINSILLNPSLEPKNLRQAALDELADLKNAKSALIQEFLRERSKFAQPAAFAVQEALMSGPFGREVLEILDDQLFNNVQSGAKPDEALKDAALALACLRAPKSVSRLSPLLRTKDVPALLSLLKAIQRVCVPGDMKAARDVAKLLMDPDRRVQIRALQTLTKLAPKGLGRLFAALYKKDKALQGTLLTHLPLLTYADYKSFMQTLSEEARQGVYTSFFPVLAKLDPSEAGECLDAAAADRAHGNAFKTLKSLIPKPKPLPVFDAEKAAMTFEAPGEKPKDKGKKEKRGKSSFFSKLGSMGNSGETLSVQFGGKDDGGGRVSDYSGKKLAHPVYEAQTLKLVKFARSLLEGAVFQDCTLLEADFGGSLFKDARFINCVFKDCDFSRARFFDCSLENAAFSRCDFQNARLVQCELTLVDARESNFQRAGMHASKIRASRFTAVDFSRFSLTGTNAAGAEFIHCHFQNAVLKDLSVTDCAFTAPDFAACRVQGLATDSPVLLELEEQCYRERIVRMEQEAGGDAHANGPDKEAALLAARAAKKWFINRDMRAAERAFLTNNERRVNWCAEKLGPHKYEFFRILPLLLHSEMFERSRQNVPILPFACRMAEYQPDYTTLETAKKYFPDAELPKEEPDPVFIEALFTIGSVGTIAQSSDSDLDYWVCFDPEGMPEMLLDGLTFKLESIERWAEEKFGLEVHFFPMDQTLIQNNNFGFSDSESSGSAQALLLKEEFYRTAVSVAGKRPVWWLTPTEATQKDYAEVLSFIGRSKTPDRFIDLGNLEQIPLEEFFGASLWQIVKALKSPFKSIMKFALLEKYTAQDTEGKNRLLSDLLKENLRSGKTSIMQVDPYMLMFHEVGDYYTQVCDRDSLELVRLSFFLKTNVRGQLKEMEVPLRAEEKEIRDLATGQIGSLMCVRDLDIGEEWDFGKIISFGGMVNKFIIRTYLKVRDKLAKSKDIVITPEDLTKLGRKIFSTFSRREHKIEHVPFVSLGDSSFRVLHFAAYGKKMGQPSEWSIQGAQKVSTSKRLDLVDLKKGGLLAELLVWLTANGVYSSEVPVKGDYSISPVTTRDIKGLMDKLLDFFPPSETFNTDIGETLNPERIVKALFVLNLIKPREQNQILEVSIIYSTNWGELFCRTLPIKDNSLQAHPLEFLRRNAPQACLKEPVMEFFIPDRSKCPELMLS